MKNRFLLAASAAFLFSSASFGATYDIDTDHSTVGFKIRHLLSKTSGRFDKFAGTIQFEEGKPDSWKVEATIQAASINTNNEKRDAHLKSKDFFDVDNAKNPEMKTLKFVSTKVTDVKGTKAKVHGNLTIHGVTKPVVLDMEVLGTGSDPWGNKKAAFTASTTINRKDYGLTWNQALETGGVLVGEDVEITLDVEANAKEVASPKDDAKAKAPAKKK